MMKGRQGVFSKIKSTITNIFGYSTADSNSQRTLVRNPIHKTCILQNEIDVRSNNIQNFAYISHDKLADDLSNDGIDEFEYVKQVESIGKSKDLRDIIDKSKEQILNNSINKNGLLHNAHLNNSDNESAENYPFKFCSEVTDEVAKQKPIQCSNNTACSSHNDINQISNNELSNHKTFNAIDSLPYREQLEDETPETNFINSDKYYKLNKMLDVKQENTVKDGQYQTLEVDNSKVSAIKPCCIKLMNLRKLDIEQYSKSTIHNDLKHNCNMSGSFQNDSQNHSDHEYVSDRSANDQETVKNLKPYAISCSVSVNENAKSDMQELKCSKLNGDISENNVHTANFFSSDEVNRLSEDLSKKNTSSMFQNDNLSEEKCDSSNFKCFSCKKRHSSEYSECSDSCCGLNINMPDLNASSVKSVKSKLVKPCCVLLPKLDLKLATFNKSHSEHRGMSRKYIVEWINNIIQPEHVRDDLKHIDYSIINDCSLNNGLNEREEQFEESEMHLMEKYTKPSKRKFNSIDDSNFPYSTSVNSSMNLLNTKKSYNSQSKLFKPCSVFVERLENVRSTFDAHHLQLEKQQKCEKTNRKQIFKLTHKNLKVRFVDPPFSDSSSEVNIQQYENKYNRKRKAKLLEQMSDNSECIKADSQFKKKLNQRKKEKSLEKMIDDSECVNVASNHKKLNGVDDDGDYRLNDNQQLKTKFNRRKKVKPLEQTSDDYTVSDDNSQFNNHQFINKCNQKRKVKPLEQMSDDSECVNAASNHQNVSIVVDGHDYDVSDNDSQFNSQKLKNNNLRRKVKPLEQISDDYSVSDDNSWFNNQQFKNKCNQKRKIKPLEQMSDDSECVNSASNKKNLNVIDDDDCSVSDNNQFNSKQFKNKHNQRKKVKHLEQTSDDNSQFDNHQFKNKYNQKRKVKPLEQMSDDSECVNSASNNKNLNFIDDDDCSVSDNNQFKQFKNKHNQRKKVKPLEQTSDDYMVSDNNSQFDNHQFKNKYNQKRKVKPLEQMSDDSEHVKAASNHQNDFTVVDVHKYSVSDSDSQFNNEKLKKKYTRKRKVKSSKQFSGDSECTHETSGYYDDNMDNISNWSSDFYVSDVDSRDDTKCEQAKKHSLNLANPECEFSRSHSCRTNMLNSTGAHCKNLKPCSVSIKRLSNHVSDFGSEHLNSKSENQTSETTDIKCSVGSTSKNVIKPCSIVIPRLNISDGMYEDGVHIDSQDMEQFGINDTAKEARFYSGAVSESKSTQIVEVQENISGKFKNNVITIANTSEEISAHSLNPDCKRRYSLDSVVSSSATETMSNFQTDSQKSEEEVHSKPKHLHSVVEGEARQKQNSEKIKGELKPLKVSLTRIQKSCTNIENVMKSQNEINKISLNEYSTFNLMEINNPGVTSSNMVALKPVDLSSYDLDQELCDSNMSFQSVGGSLYSGSLSDIIDALSVEIDKDMPDKVTNNVTGIIDKNSENISHCSLDCTQSAAKDKLRNLQCREKIKYHLKPVTVTITKIDNTYMNIENLTQSQNNTKSSLSNFSIGVNSLDTSSCKKETKQTNCIQASVNNTLTNFEASQTFLSNHKHQSEMTSIQNAPEESLDSESTMNFHQSKDSSNQLPLSSNLGKTKQNEVNSNDNTGIETFQPLNDVNNLQQDFNLDKENYDTEFHFRSKKGEKYIVDYFESENIKKIFVTIGLNKACEEESHVSDKNISECNEEKVSEIETLKDAEIMDKNILQTSNLDEPNSEIGDNKKSGISCVQCLKTFSCQNDIFDHICSGKRKKGFMCEFCEKIFPSLRSIANHKRLHNCF